MKKILYFIAVIWASHSYSQQTEFSQSNNGLIYSDTTIKQLRHIVDSLNLKFKVCDINRSYLSYFQTKAHYINLKNGNIKKAKRDIESNISFEEFMRKYPNSKTERDLLIIKFQYTNREKQEILEFRSVGINDKYDHSFKVDKDISQYNKPLKGKWILQIFDKTNYSEERLIAIYFTEEFKQQTIPEKYAKMIQYSDCLVDSSSSIFLENSIRSGVRYPKERPEKLKLFMEYLELTTKKPVYKAEGEDDDEADKSFYTAYKNWDSARISITDSLITHDAKFMQLLKEATQDSLSYGRTDDEFEEYVGRYISKKKELEFKRRRRVVGGCSMDNSPRVHALNIAKLSAETINWEIFLRAHLDIMNDRFDRLSDGSYAWAKRKTYIKELEVLDIDVNRLLLGICLRIENESKNHYFGSINRIGKALSETSNTEDIETKMIEMISDNQLDDFNRLLIVFLYKNYINYLEDKNLQKINIEKLDLAIQKMPLYISTKIAEEKK